MKRFESEKQDLEIDTEVNWEPVELFKNRCYMFSGSSSGNNTSSCILNHLQFMEGFMR